MSIQTGIITAVRYKALGRGKVCEVKVEVDGRVTAWLPKIGNVGGAFKMHIPPRVKDQVIVHNQNGKHEDGYVSDNIAYVKQPLPKNINENKISMWSKDGTHIDYDLVKKKISVKTPSKVDVIAPSVKVKAKKVEVIATSVKVIAPEIDLEGIVTVKGALKVKGTVTNNGTNIGDNHAHGYDDDHE